MVDRAEMYTCARDHRKTPMIRVANINIDNPDEEESWINFIKAYFDNKNGLNGEDVTEGRYKCPRCGRQVRILEDAGEFQFEVLG